MSFFDKIFRRHKDDFSFEDEPITGYDPAASKSKVSDYLGSQNSEDPMTKSYDSDSGLPPDPLAPSSESSSFEPSNANAQMNGMTGQDMAEHYKKNQEYMQNQNSQSKTGNTPSREEEIINLKLDSMKNQLDAISQRIQRIEQLLQSSSNKKW